MADAQGIVMGLADLAVKVKDKADQAEANQVTCKVLVSANNTGWARLIRRRLIRSST